MAALSVLAPYPIFNDRDGQPIDNGRIYIGTVNLDPVANPIQVYWDEALTIPAAQPINTLGGYPVYQGTPGRLYVNADNFSITVKDNQGLLVWTELDGANANSASNISFVGFKGQVGYVSDLADNDGSDWIGFEQDGTGAVAISAQDKMRQVVSPTDFGAVGDGIANDKNAFDLADALGKRIHVPAGDYLIGSSLTISSQTSKPLRDA